ncbi:MAG TPA: DUF4390 domain-containing protein [Thermoanaerobaculia bacterium]|nr:DUF4390 domain-containing protein [Thermoanaerobaculia bacterium]
MKGRTAGAVVIALAALVAIFVAPSAHAAHIANIKVHLEQRTVVVGFDLENAFTKQFVDRIQSGLPTSLTYDIQLHRDHIRWWDHKLMSTSLRVVAMYNAVTREYLVNYKQNGKLVESRVVHSVQELKAAMTHVSGLHAFMLDDLPHDWRLLVKVQAELGSRTILSLIPVTVTTDWADSNKFRAPAGPND